MALNTNLWLENPGRNAFSTRDRGEPWESRRSREGVLGVVREPLEVRENRVHDEDPAQQFSWLEGELHKARMAKKTVSRLIIFVFVFLFFSSAVPRQKSWGKI